jgi:hypothetical protein
MKLRTLFLGALTAGFAHTGAATADFTPIEIKIDETEIGTIEVEGNYDAKVYDHVVLWGLRYSIWARGDTPTSQGDRPSHFLIQMRNRNNTKWTEKYEGLLYKVWHKYSIYFDYEDYVIGDSEARLAPINRCNDRLMRTTGEARKEFLFKGTTITVNKAYKFRGYVPSGGEGDAEWTYAPVKIKCFPLDPVSVRATLRIEPAKFEKLGKFLCPMELNLYGAVESREEFSGKSIFVGPHYLSAISDLNYAQAGSRNVRATYKIKWQQPIGGLTTAPNQEPKKQDLTFRFNVLEQSDSIFRESSVVEAAEKRVQVSCRKIKSNAPTAGNGMTTNPAD